MKRINFTMAERDAVANVIPELGARSPSQVAQWRAMHRLLAKMDAAIAGHERTIRADRRERVRARKARKRIERQVRERAKQRKKRSLLETMYDGYTDY